MEGTRGSRMTVSLLQSYFAFTKNIGDYLSSILPAGHQILEPTDSALYRELLENGIVATNEQGFMTKRRSWQSPMMNMREVRGHGCLA